MKKVEEIPSLDKMVMKLRHPKEGVTLYEIAFRRAGWGYVFHHQDVEIKTIKDEVQRMRSGLVVERYYRTFVAATRAEYKRFFGKEKTS
jgi:hypothetical protein